MENRLEQLMEGMLNKPGVYGCVFSNHQGLGLGAKGKASINSSGIISAIANLAEKLEVGNSAPVITYENDNGVCIIKREGDITGAVFKSTN